MKLVYISYSRIPSHTANSIHVMKMCQGFIRNGHDLTLFSPDFRNLEMGDVDPFSFYGVQEKFKLKKIKYFSIKGNSHIYGLTVGVAAKIKRPDLVYGRFLYGCFWSALMGFPVIYESHSPVSDQGWVAEVIFRKLIRTRSLKRLVVISHASKQHYLQEYHIPEHMILVAHDAADKPSNVISNIGPKNNRLKVGYIGNLYTGKGADLIIELAKTCSFADFVVIGGQKEEVAFYMQKSKGINNLHFIGFRPPAETELLRASFDVLLGPFQKKVAPSGNKGDISKWMSPLKIFEYMSAKKLIIVSDLPVLREVLNESNALLVEVDNINAWVSALIKAQDSQLRERLATKAYDDFLGRFTWEARAKNVLEGFNN